MSKNGEKTKNGNQNVMGEIVMVAGKSLLRRDNKEFRSYFLI